MIILFFQLDESKDRPTSSLQVVIGSEVRFEYTLRQAGTFQVLMLRTKMCSTGKRCIKFKLAAGLILIEVLDCILRSLEYGVTRAVL